MPRHFLGQPKSNIEDKIPLQSLLLWHDEFMPALFSAYLGNDLSAF